MNANKNVIAGIETVAKRFKENTLFIKRGVIPRFLMKFINTNGNQTALKMNR